MDRLLDPTRPEGYPGVGETWEAVDNTAKYVQYLCEGLQMSGYNAIWLSSKALIAYTGQIGNAKIVPFETKIQLGSPDYPTRDRLIENPKKYSLKNISETVDVYMEGSSEVIPACILRERYEIVLADANNSGWTFHVMKDIFEQKRWNDISLLAVTLPTGFSFHVGNFIRYDRGKTLFELQITLNHPPSINSIQTVEIDAAYANAMNFPVTGSTLTAICGGGNQFRNVPVFIARESASGPILIKIDYSAYTGGIQAQTIIRGSVILK